MIRYYYLMTCIVIVCSTVQATEGLWRYPSKISDLSDVKCGCWDAIDRSGKFPEEGSEDYLVAPDVYLVDAPPTSETAISVTTDRWLECTFPGPIIDGDGHDIEIREKGQMGERALILLSDGQSKTYPLGIAEIPNSQAPYTTVCEFDIERVDPGFVPTAIRIVSLGLGGGSPGFDVGSVRARIAVDNTKPHMPYPSSGANNVSPLQTLQWFPSGQANSVDVFLDTDPALVAPSTATPFSSLTGDANTLSMPNEVLELGRTYYWRVVEHQNNMSRTSELWQFTVSPYLKLEDFAAYAHTGENKWKDDRNLPVRLTNDPNNVYRGCHAAALSYDCAEGDADAMTRAYGLAVNMQSPNLDFLELSFRGLPSNPPGHTLFCRLYNTATYDGDPNHINDGLWHTWRIPLETLGGYFFIDSLEIGVQAFSDTPQTLSSGTVFIDEIQFSAEDVIAPPRPEPLQTDLDQDMQLTPKDLTLFADAWLSTDQDELTTQEPNEPWCFFPFEDTALDLQGNAQASLSGNLLLDQHHADFNSPDATLLITNGQSLNQFTRGITVSFWQWGFASNHRTDTLVCSDYAYPIPSPELAIGLGLWDQPERLFWQCGERHPQDNLVTGIHQATEHWSGRWNHWAFTKDFATGQMSACLNGRVLYETQGQAAGLARIDRLLLGNGWYSHYDGLMDDFRIHDYALNGQECAYLATHGTGVLPQPSILPSDFNGDGLVDWQDFAYLASEWVASE